MPEIVGRWCARCCGAIGGRKFYISGVAELDTSIWDVLAPQEERVGVGEHLCGDRFVELSQLGNWCQLGLLRLGFAPGLVGLSFSWKKKLYITSYNVFTCNVIVYIHQGRREWVDALG